MLDTAAAARSAAGWPRSGSKAASTASSMLVTAGSSRGEGGAGGLEVAVVAQGSDVGAEVLGIAGSLNGRPDGDGAPALAADRLFGWHRRNGDGLAQVEQPDLGRGPSEQALAQERIGLDAAHAAAFEALRRGAPRFVVDDDQAA